MFSAMIQSIPLLIKQVPPAIQPMVQMLIQKKLAAIHPIQLENFNRDFEALLDGIAQKDFGTVALLLERYHIPADGIIEQCITRMMQPCTYPEPSPAPTPED